MPAFGQYRRIAQVHRAQQLLEQQVPFGQLIGRQDMRQGVAKLALQPAFLLVRDLPPAADQASWLMSISVPGLIGAAP